MGISIPQLLIILLIVLLLFGSKRLRHVGSDLGGAIKGFRRALGHESHTSDEKNSPLSDEKNSPVSSKLDHNAPQAKRTEGPDRGEDLR